MSASVTVMDPIALDMINHYGGEFGRERLFSTIGMAIFSPLTGVLIDYRSQKLGNIKLLYFVIFKHICNHFMLVCHFNFPPYRDSSMIS